ncbi:MAG TPA: DNA-binding protein HU [Gammaproteobacteria bacterium]|nr:DNA-binding protein HU [Gammaproteobacteria bacterium]
MNKSELIDAVADAADIPRAVATRAVEAVTDSITAALQRDDTVTLVGFGSFLVSKREARTGRNPKTGEPIELKAARVPKFRPGKALKDALG